MVVKPATATPLSAFALAELGARAGLPAGLLSVITGKAGAIGGEMTSNALVRKVTFTGSTEIGKELMAQSSATVKKVALELGGNAPFIVFDDADIDAAVEGAVASKYRNTGQTCICTNRFLVQSKVHDAFVEKLTAKVAALKIGSGFEEGVARVRLSTWSPSKGREHIADALAGGAKVTTGGKRHAKGGSSSSRSSYRHEAEMKVCARKHSPACALLPLRDGQERSRSQNHAFRPRLLFLQLRYRPFGVWRALEYGLVGVNAGIISTEVAPFGGLKESGLGREGGPWGIEEFLEVKYVAMAGL